MPWNGYAGLVDVCSITDVDEYLRPLNGRTDIPSAIAEIFANSEVSAAVVNWAIYGSSGQLEPSGELVIERFARRGEDNNDLHRTVKTIVRPERFVAMVNPHVATITGGAYVNDCGEPIEWAEAARTKIKSWNSLRIDHFSVKSRMEFITKVRKGRPEALPGTDDRDEAFFAHHDCNEIVDPVPADFIDRTKMELKLLRSELKKRFPLGAWLRAWGTGGESQRSATGDAQSASGAGPPVIGGCPSERGGCSERPSAARAVAAWPLGRTIEGAAARTGRHPRADHFGILRSGLVSAAISGRGEARD